MRPIGDLLKREHDDVIKWKHFPRYWPFVRGIHRWPVNSPHKDQWRGALMFSLICAWINGWVNNREAGDYRCHHAHYDVTVMINYITKTLKRKCSRCVHFVVIGILGAVMVITSSATIDQQLILISQPFRSSEREKQPNPRIWKSTSKVTSLLYWRSCWLFVRRFTVVTTTPMTVLLT